MSLPFHLPVNSRFVLLEASSRWGCSVFPGGAGGVSGLRRLLALILRRGWFVPQRGDAGPRRGPFPERQRLSSRSLRF